MRRAREDQRLLDRDFTEFVEARWPRLVRAAYLMGCPKDQAEDVAQGALLSAYRNWSRVRGADSPDAYLSTMLLNELRRSRRKVGPALALAAVPEPMIQSPSDLVVAGVDLGSALARLSSDQRTILVLRYFNDLSVEETAEVLGIPAGTVKSRSARAIDALRAFMVAHEESSRHE